MTTGLIIAVLLLLVCSKFIVKRVYRGTHSKIFNLFHKILGLIFAGAIVIHLILVLPLIHQRPVLMYILGFIMLLMAVISILSYFLRKKLKKRWIVIHRISAVILILCMVVHIITGFTSLSAYKSKIAAIEIEGIDTSSIPDGEYHGSYDAGYIYADVTVTIKSGVITDVQLNKHLNERGGKAVSIPDTIVKEKRNDVDTVSSATNSSKVIMKAVMNALQ